MRLGPLAIAVTIQPKGGPVFDNARLDGPHIYKGGGFRLVPRTDRDGRFLFVAWRLTGPYYHPANAAMTSCGESLRLYLLAQLAGWFGIQFHVEGLPFGAPGKPVPGDDTEAPDGADTIYDAGIPCDVEPSEPNPIWRNPDYPDCLSPARHA